MKPEKAIELAERLLDYPESEWDQLISDWCGKNIDLKQEVIHLAESNRNSRDFVEEFQKRIYTLTKSSLTAGLVEPEQIAGFKIIRRLGSGGSATVYLVENKEGQKGALKLLKGYLADEFSRQRFTSENHILSTLNHPNIARLIEGGITESGEPYVIMEYVDGIPVDLWCNRNKLNINERIRLFQAVCRAVHYAHQNLVVHRDIKPEHVLVTKTGELKLIDFGIAKLLEPSSSEAATLQTRTGMRIMTPEFASPEQVRGETVTTASDIYSLGILLYLLTTGRRPYEFKTASLLEIERVVCEREPMKPSEAVAIYGSETVTGKAGFDPVESARLRGVELPRLRKQLAGDLDRIVLMAMRKEPVQRYSSALSISGDLERYILGEPVLARAPTFTYRARKFMYRHKWAVAGATVAVLALTAGLLGTVWQSRQAQVHAHRAETQAQIAGQVTDFLIDLFEAGDPAITQGTEITIERLLARGVEQALEFEQEATVQLNLLSVLGRVYSSMGIHNKSTELFETALKKADQLNPSDPLIVADLQSRLGFDLRVMGNLSVADSLYRLALENRKTALGDDHPLTIQSLDDWAGIHAYLTRDTELADLLFQDVVNRRRAVLDPLDKDLAESLSNLAYIKMTKGEYHMALRFYEEAAEIYRVTLGENHPDRLRTMSSIAVAYHRTGNFGRSEQMYNSLIEKRKNVLGENHPQVAVSYYHLAELLKDTGRVKGALSSIQKASGIMNALDASHQFYPDILFSMADIYVRNNLIDEAIDAYHQTAQKCMEIRGIHSPGCIKMYQSVGEFFLSQQNKTEALLYLKRAYEGLNQREEPSQLHITKLAELIESAQSDL